MLKRAGNWLKTQKHKFKSLREMQKQIGQVRTENGVIIGLKDGGSVPAAKMLNLAIHASYLPAKTRRNEIIKWVNQIKLHLIASEASKIPRPPYQEKMKEINAYAEQLIVESLRMADLKS